MTPRRDLQRGLNIITAAQIAATPRKMCMARAAGVITPNTNETTSTRKMPISSRFNPRATADSRAGQATAGMVRIEESAGTAAFSSARFTAGPSSGPSNAAAPLSREPCTRTRVHQTS